MKLKNRLCFLLCAVMTAFCAECKPAPEDALSIHQSALEAEAAPQEATIDTLSVGILEDAGRRHPLFPQSAQMVSLTALVFEGLFETDDAGRAGFCLAEDYQTAQNEDGSFTWTIKIRPNVAWHDGSGCVTAQDAAFTIGTIASAGGFYASNVQGIASAAAQDEQTLVIVTDRYYADLPERLTFPIVPQHVYQGKNGEDPVMVGSGAYRLSAQDADGYLFQLSAFEGWWHEQPSIKTIYVTTYHDLSALTAAFSRKEIQAAIDCDVTTGEGLGAGIGTVYTLRRRSMEVVYPNLNGIFSDVRVRRAVAYAINKSDISALLYAKRTFDADLPVWPGHYLDTAQSHRYDYDVRAARELLAQAGYEDRDGDGYLDVVGEDGQSAPLTLSLVTSNTADSRIRQQCANLIAEALRQVGIALQVTVSDLASAQAAFSAGQFHLLLTGVVVPQQPQPAFFYVAANYNGASSETVQSALSATYEKTTRAEWETSIAALEQAILDECTSFPLFYTGGVLIVDSRVTGVDPHGETDALHGMANWIFYEKAAS